MNHEEILAVLLPERTKLIAAAWSILKDGHAAEDVYQELMVKVLDDQRSFEGPKHLLSWSWTVVRRRCYEIVRQQSRRRILLDESLQSLLDQELECRRVDGHVEQLDAMRGCLRKLTPQARELVRLRYFEGLAGKQVAEQLGRKVDTVYKGLERSYAALRACIRAQLNDLESPA